MGSDFGWIDVFKQHGGRLDSAAQGYARLVVAMGKRSDYPPSPGAQEYRSVADLRNALVWYAGRGCHTLIVDAGRVAEWEEYNIDEAINALNKVSERA
ncbi:MAG TPA: hypothetical protein VMZ71_14430 [Gemmataceae bacterium]|nr:hypothetical protein [Gemmataceae bacterium]